MSLHMKMDAIQRDILEKLYAEHLSGYTLEVPWQRIHKIQQKEAYLAAAQQLDQQGFIEARITRTLNDTGFVSGTITDKGIAFMQRK